MQQSQKQRDEIHKTIWNIANKLRGSVTGWDFKQYVLGTLFYRFISEKFKNYINESYSKNDKNFNYANLDDEKIKQMPQNNKIQFIKEIGFFMLPSELFENVAKNAYQMKENLNEKLESIFKNIENSAKGSGSESDLSGLFDDFDINSKKLGTTVVARNEKLADILSEVAKMNFDFSDNKIDAFGDAYEFLMTMYASNAGKSGGEFFTPQEVSELLTKIVANGKEKLKNIYDPACGSGSLLLKAIKVLGKENIGNFCGQEIELTTYNLCRMNMFLHGLEFDKFDIAHGDTLVSPFHSDEKFQAVVSNPPYSIKWKGDDDPILINDARFSPAGILAPKSKADLAFVMHALYHLASNGTAAIVMFPGTMYRSGAEQKIRKYLVENDFVDAIINLPQNLFFGTSIQTNILVLKKGKTNGSCGNVLFINAENEFEKSTNNNKLTPKNIDKIMQIYKERKQVQFFSRKVEISQIKENDFNLSVSSYVEQEDKSEKIDIKELNSQISAIVKNQQILRSQIDKIVADLESAV